MRHTSGNQECTIQRDWQHEAHTRQPRMYNPETLATLGTQAKTKNVQSRHRAKTKHNTTQKTKKTSNTDPTNNWGRTDVLANGKQFLPLIRYPPCYSYNEDCWTSLPSAFNINLFIL
jgi:hypothetical protein